MVPCERRAAKEVGVIDIDESLAEELREVLVDPFYVRDKPPDANEVDGENYVCDVLCGAFQRAWSGGFEGCDCYEFDADVGKYREWNGDPTIR